MAKKKKETTVSERADQDSKPRYAEAASYTLTSLEQVKALADPFRIRLLESFCQERTTKQVAVLIGERPTRLYHHVDALEKVGLIQLSRTRPNRGTLEKYYLAVARTFLTDSTLFSAGPDVSEDNQAMYSMLSTIFNGTKNEMRQILTGDHAEKSLQEEGILSYVEIQASEQLVMRYHKRLKDLFSDLQNDCDEELAKEEGESTSTSEREPDRRYRLTLAYFPLDR